MKGDFTRSTFRREKHYSSVRLQQGRVQLDADWNEEVDILNYLDETTRVDVIGACGVPKVRGGFAITPNGGGTDLTIGDGRIYVDGILAENDAPIDFVAQPDLPDAQPIADPGTYLVYLDVWQRHITALEDDAIREVALGGPDTATRTRTTWQVQLLSLGDENASITCQTLPNWQAQLDPAKGKLSAQAEPQIDAANNCIVEPGAGYRRLENQLYRVEIHEDSSTGQATFKWSRDNGSVVTRWQAKNGDDLTVSSLGRDKLLGFAPGQWIELTDDTHELLRQPGTLVRILKAEGQVITIDPVTATGSVSIADFPQNPKVRRWDMPAATGLIDVTGGTWFDLEDGVQVQFDMSGVYRTGDYWLIPARTATADVEWPFTTPQLPHGVQHHYCALAITKKFPEQALVAGDIEDCRDRFPSLTTICAEDVCYDDGTCELGAETVQQALDRLCRERDLRFHKKHLHGWGIVCGLEVVCGPDGEDRRSHVTVKPGYAIDCEGNDIVQDQAAPIDLLQVALEQKLIEPGRPGDVCITLNRDGTYGFEKYDPKQDNHLQALLAGTLLLDFYNDCIKNIQEFLEEELTPPPGEENSPAGPVKQRVAALTNLLAQPVNPQTGQNIFISPREDKLLRDFYQGLRELLQSETFCAMFDNARPFPDYPFATLGLDTIFAKSNHTRLRLRPGGKEAYTAGPGLNPLKPSTMIYRFDLVKRVLISQIDPLTQAEGKQATHDSGAGAVEDIAFSPDGKQIYVIMPTKNKQNTLFRAGTIAKDGIRWGTLFTICGTQLVTLATTAADPQVVYAIGQGSGLYRITPGEVDANLQPLVAFNAVGHVKIAADGRAFATAAAAGAAATSYTTIVRIQVPAGTRGADIPLNATGHDDMTLFTAREGARAETVYSVVDSASGAKAVLAHDLNSGSLIAQIPIENTTVRLEPYAPTRMLLYTSDDGYCLRLIDMNTNQRVANYLLPLQVGPIAVAADAPTESGYVLNQISDTISVAPGNLLDPAFQFPLKQLADYRKGVLEAFADLLAGFLQYLKDCLCDHFLVKCPQCDPEDKIYLACATIRDDQVYKVCNFAKRRYVKSFPTIEYWLSLVPIMPLIDRAVQEFCCIALPDLFGRFQVAEFDEPQAQAQPRLPVSALRQGALVFQNADVRKSVSDMIGKIGVTTNLFTERFTRTTAPAATATSVEAKIVDQPAAATEATLKGQGISVKRAIYEPGQALNPIGFFRAPTPGSEVTLFEENGVVRYYTVADAPSPHVVAVQTQLEAHQTQLVEAQRSLKERDDKITALDNQLTELKTSLQTTLVREARRPKIRPHEWMAYGQIIDKAGQPVTGATVRVFDQDRKLDDLLGEVATDEFGDYAIVYHERDFAELREGLPELYVLVSDAAGQELYSSADSVRFNAGRVERMDVQLGEAPPAPPAPKRPARKARK